MGLLGLLVIDVEILAAQQPIAIAYILGRVAGGTGGLLNLKS